MQSRRNRVAGAGDCICREADLKRVCGLLVAPYILSMVAASVPLTGIPTSDNSSPRPRAVRVDPEANASTQRRSLTSSCRQSGRARREFRRVAGCRAVLEPWCTVHTSHAKKPDRRLLRASQSSRTFLTSSVTRTGALTGRADSGVQGQPDAGHRSVCVPDEAAVDGSNSGPWEPGRSDWCHERGSGSGHFQRGGGFPSPMPWPSEQVRWRS